MLGLYQVLDKMDGLVRRVEDAERERYTQPDLGIRRTVIESSCGCPKQGDS